MNEYLILGFKKCKNGLWVFVGFESKGVDGVETERFYAPYEKVQNIDKLKIDGTCTPYYNKYGRVDSIIIK